MSHHLKEVFEVCDYVTVLRDGRSTPSVATSSVDHDELIHLILGRDLEELYGGPPTPRQAVVIEVDDLAGGHLEELSLSVAAGEIVGLAGLVGSGRQGALNVIFGSIPARRGSVRVHGQRGAARLSGRRGAGGGRTATE